MKLCEFLRRLTSTYKEWVATHASRTPAHDSIAAVAPFRAWRGSRFHVARDRHESPLFIGVIQERDCPPLRAINQEKSIKFFKNGRLHSANRL